MEVDFPGFAPEAFEWFAGLERDNSRAYFTATRERYEADVRGGLEAMLDELSEAFGGEVRMFRQHRDLRFTPDKPPRRRRQGLSSRGRDCAPRLAATRAITPVSTC